MVSVIKYALSSHMLWNNSPVKVWRKSKKLSERWIIQRVTSLSTQTEAACCDIALFPPCWLSDIFVGFGADREGDLRNQRPQWGAFCFTLRRLLPPPAVIMLSARLILRICEARAAASKRTYACPTRANEVTVPSFETGGRCARLQCTEITTSNIKSMQLRGKTTKQQDINPKGSTLKIKHSGCEPLRIRWASPLLQLQAQSGPREVFEGLTSSGSQELRLSFPGARETNLFSGAKESLNVEKEAEGLTWTLCYTFSFPHLCLRWGLAAQNTGIRIN